MVAMLRRARQGPAEHNRRNGRKACHFSDCACQARSASWSRRAGLWSACHPVDTKGLPKGVCLRAWGVNAPGSLGRRLLHCAQIRHSNSQVPDAQESPHRGWSCSARPLQDFPRRSRAPLWNSSEARAATPRQASTFTYGAPASWSRSRLPRLNSVTGARASCFCVGVRDDLWAGESVTA